MTIQYLDPEIANEGLRADMPVEGQWTPGGEFQPFIDPPVIPDYAFVKQKGMEHLRKLFPQHSGIPYVHQAFPVWAYHKTEPARLLHTEQHATEHGMRYVKKTKSFDCTGEWSDEPFHVAKLNVDAPGAGKSVAKPGGNASQADTIAAVVAAVMAQVAPKVTGNALATVPQVSDPDYAKFIAFKEWLAQQGSQKAPVQLSPDEEKAALVKIAGEAGVKVDKRWSIDSIKEALDKAGK